jgi:hypothetical protein
VPSCIQDGHHYYVIGAYHHLQQFLSYDITMLLSLLRKLNLLFGMTLENKIVPERFWVFNANFNNTIFQLDCAVFL